jgi:hypothetical protein
METGNSFRLISVDRTQHYQGHAQKIVCLVVFVTDGRDATRFPRDPLILIRPNSGPPFVIYHHPVRVPPVLNRRRLSLYIHTFLWRTSWSCLSLLAAGDLVSPKQSKGSSEFSFFCVSPAIRRRGLAIALNYRGRQESKV